MTHSSSEKRSAFLFLDPKRVSPVDPLFVVSNYGNLVEYNIEIHPLKNSPQSEDMPFEAVAIAKGQWPFYRSVAFLSIFLSKES